MTSSQEQHQPLNTAALTLIRYIVKLLGQIDARLAARYAFRLWHTTQRFKLPTREGVWRQQAHAIQLTSAGKKLVVYEWGKGPNVLLIHGWSGRGMQFGAMAAGLQRAGYRAVAVDLPAHGQSSGKRTNAYLMADAILEVAAHYKDVHGVVSHSFGMLPVLLALRRQLVAQHIVAICPPDSMLPLFDIFCKSLHISPDIKQALRQLTEKHYGDTIWEDVSPASNVKSLGQPALIIHDENDKELSWHRGRALADQWPDTEFQLTQGLGHRRILRDNGVIGQVADYLDNNH